MVFQAHNKICALIMRCNILQIQYIIFIESGGRKSNNTTLYHGITKAAPDIDLIYEK